MTYVQDTTPELTPEDFALIKSTLPGEHRLVALLCFSFPGWTKRLLDAARAEGRMAGADAMAQAFANALKNPAEGHPERWPMRLCGGCGQPILYDRMTGTRCGCSMTATQVSERQERERFRDVRGEPYRFADIPLVVDPSVPPGDVMFLNDEGMVAAAIQRGEVQLVEPPRTREEFLELMRSAAPPSFTLEDVKAQAEPGETIEVERVERDGAIDRIIIRGAGAVSEARIRERMPLGVRVVFEPHKPAGR